MSCLLSQLLASFPVVPQHDLTVSGVTLDSRQVKPGDVFVALSGATVDGRSFIEQAIKQGAVAILCEGEAGYVERQGIPCYQLPQLAQQLPALAGACYSSTENQPTVFGVTGTNGKTSVTHYIATLASALNTPAAVLGTLGYGEPQALQSLANTTPDVLTVHRLLDQLRRDYSLVAMEVSSHGLVQRRAAGVAFNTAIFTNLSRDHLDFHHDMASYGAAKRQLLAWPTLKRVILNADDSFVRDSLEHCPPHVERYLFSLQDHLPRESLSGWLVVKTCRVTEQGFSVLLASSWGAGEAQIPLLGRFNLSNALAAITTLAAWGLPLHALLAVASQLRPVAGRMERFSQPQQPQVVVDYAHTPDALDNALQALRSHCAGRLFCVFGCGGDRDRGKRPLMAAVAEQLADCVVITADNSRSEAFSAISADIVAGLQQPHQVQIIEDRAAAIKWAIEQAGAQDMVLIAGKGHEDYQLTNGQRHHFSDREYVHQLLGGIA